MMKMAIGVLVAMALLAGTTGSTASIGPHSAAEPAASVGLPPAPLEPVVGSGAVESSASAAWAGIDRPAPVATDGDRMYSFYFARGRYTGGGLGRRSGWAVDAPDADRWIVSVIRRLTLIDAYPRETYVSLDDPRLRNFPFLYILEVGSMYLQEAEVQGLRDYLLAGGFLMVDDFWGSREWANWEREIRRVLPEYEIVQLPMDHEIFSTIYHVEELVQVPSIGNARRGITHEQDGFVPYCLGIFDDRGRLMVVINFNTDLGDAWEWAEDLRYPLEYSTYAYQMAANIFVHAMTH